MNPTPAKHILVAGIGNIFFGDDAFGSEVARELMRLETPLPLEATVIDFGIRSQDLAYALADDGYREVVILVDATSRGRPPGTLYLIEPDLNELEDAGEDEPIDNAHGMNPVRALRTVRAIGVQGCPRTYVLACEPEILETEALGLSESVQAAVPRAVEEIRSLVDNLLLGNPISETASA